MKLGKILKMNSINASVNSQESKEFLGAKLSREGNKTQKSVPLEGIGCMDKVCFQELFGNGEHR